MEDKLRQQAKTIADLEQLCQQQQAKAEADQKQLKHSLLTVEAVEMAGLLQQQQQQPSMAKSQPAANRSSPPLSLVDDCGSNEGLGHIIDWQAVSVKAFQEGHKAHILSLSPRMISIALPIPAASPRALSRAFTLTFWLPTPPPPRWSTCRLC